MEAHKHFRNVSCASISPEMGTDLFTWERIYSHGNAIIKILQQPPFVKPPSTPPSPIWPDSLADPHCIPWRPPRDTQTTARG